MEGGCECVERPRRRRWWWLRRRRAAKRVVAGDIVDGEIDLERE